MSSTMIKVRWGACTALVVGLAWAAAQAQPAPASLQGEWTVVEAERQLERYPDLIGATVTFQGDKFRITRPEKSTWEGTLKVDAAKGRVDFLHEGNAMLPPVRGDHWEGIFRITGDTLEINTTTGHDARPSEFISGYDLTLMKLKRQ